MLGVREAHVQRREITLGEKGNLSGDDPLLTLDSIPMDALKGSPETLNAWLDTYLKYREVREVRKSNEAAADAAASAATAAEAASRASRGEEPPSPLV